MTYDMKKDRDHETLIEHPAGVAVQFSRVSGSREFFGSSIKSGSWITLTVRKAKLNNFFGETRVATESQLPLIEVDLSPAQFAELLTTMNYNIGVPGTMTYYNGNHVEKFTTPVDEIANAEKYAKESVDGHYRRRKEETATLQKMIAESKLSNKDKENIKKMIEGLSSLDRNIDFYEKRIQEAATRFTVQAKAEVEAHITHAITKLGLESLAAQKLLLTNGNGDSK